MDKEEFYRNILNICNKDTGSDLSNLVKDNPTYGHCAIVSVLAQELFGGVILRKSYTENGMEYSHYLNKLSDNLKIDFTKDQFKGNIPDFLKTEERTKEKILLNSDTLRRYNLLISRFKDIS